MIFYPHLAIGTTHSTFLHDKLIDGHRTTPRKHNYAHMPRSPGDRSDVEAFDVPSDRRIWHVVGVERFSERDIRAEAFEFSPS